MLTPLLFLLTAVLFVASVPLAAGRVRPNRFYGFRTPRVVKDERVWYPVNRMAGRNGIVLAALLGVMATLTTFGFAGFWAWALFMLAVAAGTVSTFVSAAGIVQQVDKGGPMIDYRSTFDKSRTEKAPSREKLLDKLRKN